MNRRLFLTSSVSTALAQAIPPAKTLKVVVTGGHPGDPEYGCGGTIARYVDRGDKVTLLYLNQGEKGCAGKTEKDCGSLRRSEADAACRILGAGLQFADQVDGEAAVNPGAYDTFLQVLTAQYPDVVFTHWPLDNHRDHRAISNLVYDAWLKTKKRFALYFYEVSDGEDTMMFGPTDYVDISQTESLKRSACFAHASQSPERFYTLQREVTLFRGLESGYRVAEAFVRHRESVGRALP